MKHSRSGRILVFGIAPLPWENTSKLHGSCYRTHQFVQTLLEQGHSVRLVAMRITGLEERFEHETKIERDGLSYYSVDEVSCFRNDSYLQRHHDEFQPHCIIGANIFPSTRACQIQTEVPVWADVNGYSMGEAQTKAFKDDDDSFVQHFWNQQKPALLRADKFSSASELQKHILVGELGTVGRLNQYTLGYEFVSAVPNGREPEPFEETDKSIRSQFDSNAFLVLWTGGYNLWCDVETMFQGLDGAMGKDPNIHFISTGGVIDGVDEKTYPYFQNLVAKSEHKDRFHLKGWIPFEQVPAHYLESDIGINVDNNCYESIYGARNRITDMLKAQLPVITTLGTEITRIVKEAGCGLTFPIRNPKALSELLLYAAEHREEIREMGKRGRIYFQEHFTFREATRPMWTWARHPTHAPDWDKPKPFEEAPPRKRWWQKWPGALNP